MYSIAAHATQKHSSKVSATLTKKTLDTQHSQKMQQFIENQQRIKELRQQIAAVKNEYQQLSSQKRDPSVSVEDIMDLLIHLQDSTISMETELKSLEESTNELDYLTNTGDILFKYYDIIDKGFQTEETLQMTRKPAVANSILKYLLKPAVPTTDYSSNESAPGSTDPANNDRASLLEKYMAFTETNHVKSNFVDASESVGGAGSNKTINKCHHCQSQDRSIMLNDGLIYCNECHTVEHVLIDHDRPSFKEAPKEVSYFSYKRINHFNEFGSNELTEFYTNESKVKLLKKFEHSLKYKHTLKKNGISNWRNLLHQEQGKRQRLHWSSTNNCWCCRSFMGNSWKMVVTCS